MSKFPHSVNALYGTSPVWSFLRSFAGFSVKIFLVEFFAASVSLRTFSAAPCGVFLVFTMACGVVEFL